jgi:uncharacterized protein
MLIDLTLIQKNEGGFLPVSCEVALSNQTYFGQDYIFKAPFKVTGKITNVGSELELKATARGTFHTNCDRCLREISISCEFPVEERLARFDTGVSEEDAYLYEGHEIDLDDIVLKNFLLNASSKYLCSPDCKGLCSKCGKDLNKGSCSCSTDEIDPRLAVLSEWKEEEK